MSKTKKKSSKTEIQPNREKRRNAMRRLRDAIKNDPVRYEAMKENERKRYHERVRAGKIKKNKDLSCRDQKSMRKRWRDYSKRYYNSMKNRKKIVEQLEINTPPDSPHPLDENMNYCLENNNNLETPSTLRKDTPNSSRQSNEGKKQRRRNTYKYKLNIKQLKEKLRNEKKREV
ncbi:hypothetical protein ILUMI_27440 [Ignelater luminosus]|uniref:Uncharacterized protein n=1 Tax=Ignelater luminosus TaxID=2038154 RepID=A0A8K0C3I5_IGNLU|nr:hypothetical protein ILUMI_27440 [Ignelater luminosus]